MEQSRPRIAVIIVNYNAGEYLRRCLESIVDQTVPPARTIVVDNASSDGSTENLAVRYPGIELLAQDRNLGFAAANNLAVEQTDDCDWIALLNPDTEVSPEWIARLENAIVTNAQTDMFSCRLINAANKNILDGTGDIYHVSGLGWRRDHGAPASRRRTVLDQVFSACGAAAIFRRKGFLNVGGFDESYFCYNEDTDIAFRMRLRGATCLHLDDCEVRHAGSAVTGKESDFTIYHGHRNLVWTFFKNMPSPLLWLYLPQHLLLNLTTVVYFVLKGRAGIILKAKWHALKGLPRILRERKKVQASRVVSLKALKRSMSRKLLAPYLYRHV